MRRVIASVLIAFLVGVGVGGLAFGQREVSEAPVDSVTKTETLAAPLAAASTTPASRESTDILDEVRVSQSKETAETTAVNAQQPKPLGDVQAIEAQWADLKAVVDTLTRRVGSLERQMLATVPPASEASDEAALEPLPIESPEDRSSALVVVGVDQQIADDIVWRESQMAMARLELQDRAAREGWRNTDRYFEEFSALNDQAVDLRAEVGDSAYDRFLFETGQSNRVAVRSVIPGSQGEQVGIFPGDIIEDYAGERVFAFNDLRNATTGGDREEMVRVTVRRGGSVFESWIERGPIGVSLEGATINPDF